MIALSNALVGRRACKDRSSGHPTTLREKASQDHCQMDELSLQTKVMSAIHSWFGPRTVMRLARLR